MAPPRRGHCAFCAGVRSVLYRERPSDGAFVLPLSLLLVGAATLYRTEWFYPAFMIVLGAHYLPFVTLYGMRLFYTLAAILVAAGVALVLYLPLPFSSGAAARVGAAAGAWVPVAALHGGARPSCREPGMTSTDALEGF